MGRSRSTSINHTHEDQKVCLITDNGEQFDCNEFKEFCDKLQIKKSFFSVAWPQVNSQVEAINKTIKHNFKTKLEEFKGKYVDELLEVL